MTFDFVSIIMLLLRYGRESFSCQDENWKVGDWLLWNGFYTELAAEKTL